MKALDITAIRAELAIRDAHIASLKADLADQLPMRDADAFTIGNLNAALATAQQQVRDLRAALEIGKRAVEACRVQWNIDSDEGDGIMHSEDEKIDQTLEVIRVVEAWDALVATAEPEAGR